LLGLVVFVSACKSKPNTRYHDLKAVKLAALKVNLTLPSNFREYSIEDEMEELENSDYTDEIKEMRREYLEGLSVSKRPTRFLTDSIYKENNIRITESSLYFKVGKYMSREAFLHLDKQMQQMGDLLSVKYEALENTYFTLANGNDIMKMRYRAKQVRINRAGFLPVDDEEISYSTFYVITGGGRTLFAVVNHESEDFEYFIRTIKFE
jgi:hypothetical protein